MGSQQEPLDSPETWALSRLLSTAARYVEHAFSTHLERYGMTHAGFVTLVILRDGPAPIGTLARRSGVEVQTMTRVVDRLERMGHVRRGRDPSDRRRVIVEMTPEGRRVLRAATQSDPVTDATAAVADEPALRAELARIVRAMAEHRDPKADFVGLVDDSAPE